MFGAWGENHLCPGSLLIVDSKISKIDSCSLKMKNLLRTLQQAHNPQVLKTQGTGLLWWFTLLLIYIGFGLIAGFEKFVLNWIGLPASSKCSPQHLMCCHCREGKWSKALGFRWWRGALLVGLASGSEAVFLNHFYLKDHLTLQNNLWTICVPVFFGKWDQQEEPLYK